MDPIRALRGQGERRAFSREIVRGPGERIGNTISQGPLLYVLDTSALLTFIEDEAGADQVQELLEKAKRGEVNLLVSFMSFMEAYFISLGARAGGSPRAGEVTSSFAYCTYGIERKPRDTSRRIQSCSPSISSRRLDCGAGARTGRGASAQRPEFEQVESAIKVVKLPYKASNNGSSRKKVGKSGVRMARKWLESCYFSVFNGLTT